MTVVLVTHGLIVGGTSGGTSGSLDTTGATLLIVVAASGGAVTVSDSKSNSWTGLTVRGSAPQTRIFYAANPTVGAGHIFTISGSLSAGSVLAFSGVVQATPFEVENGASTSAITIQPGSVTPAESGALIVTSLGAQSGFVNSALAIDSGFTRTDYQVFISGNSYGTAAAYLVQGAAAAVNPIWTGAASNTVASAIAVFKPVVAAAKASALLLAGL